MMHISVPKDTRCEFIELSETLNPLISKCVIKVCYVQDEPNNNHTVITKDKARKIGKSLRGVPIVGFWQPAIQDFEEHNAALSLGGSDAFNIIELTKPYGFVDINAKVWFQTFIDDNSVEREYLCTEGYIWNGQYPEADRIIAKGNNQSMDLTNDFFEGHWECSEDGYDMFFIIDEAIISNLCILGEDFEPCFEGAQIKTAFSLDNAQFKAELHSMVEEVKKLFKERSFNMADVTEVILDGGDAVEDSVNQDAEPIVEPVTEEPAAEEYAADTEPVVEESVEPIEPEPSTQSTPEIPVEETATYKALEQKYSQLSQEFEELKTNFNVLTQFKLDIEKEEKKKMINKFFMLSEDDLKDVKQNIDKYSVDDIEAKLSVICVRNKISFSAEDNNHEPQDITTLTDFGLHDESAPEWVQAVMETAKNNTL